MKIDKQLEAKIKKAFENEKYEWRTVKGVAKEANTSYEIVQSYVSSHGDELVKSSARNDKGERLFTSRKNYRDRTGPGARILSILRNRGA